MAEVVNNMLFAEKVCKGGGGSELAVRMAVVVVM